MQAAAPMPRDELQAEHELPGLTEQLGWLPQPGWGREPCQDWGMRRTQVPHPLAKEVVTGTSPILPVIGPQCSNSPSSLKHFARGLRTALTPSYS